MRTRGPVHEAFAEPVNLGRGQAAVILRHPPVPLIEAPPDVRPDTENIAWIPGYWSWDRQRNDFLWISGVWRVPPPGMQWIPGYWAEVDGRFRWASGLWVAADIKDLVYYSPPPEPVDEEVSGMPPSPADFWVPGSWIWERDDFVRTRGYWAHAQPGWVWTPASYCWTPRGYVLSNAYWDYPLDSRGMLFAPVVVSPDIYRRADSVYTPSVAVDPALLSFYLFVRPAYGHYYFGDYFAGENLELGIYPWYITDRYPDYHYDPLLAYDRWYYGTRDPQWITNLQRWNAYYRRHPEARPPHDLAAEQRMAAQAFARPDREFLMVARPLGTEWQDSVFPLRLARVSTAERNLLQETVRITRDLEGQRLRTEAAGRLTSTGGGSGSATAMSGPQKAMLLHRDMSLAALHASGNRGGLAAPAATKIAQRQVQYPERFPGGVARSELGTAPPTRHAVLKPVMPPTDAPPASEKRDEERDPWGAPHQASPGQGPHPRLVPPIGRHPQAPDEQSPAAARPSSLPEERKAQPPRVEPPAE